MSSKPRASTAPAPWSTFWQIKFPLILPQFGLIVDPHLHLDLQRLRPRLRAERLGAGPELLDRHSGHALLPHLLRLERAGRRPRSRRHRRHRDLHLILIVTASYFWMRPAPAQELRCRMTDACARHNADRRSPLDGRTLACMSCCSSSSRWRSGRSSMVIINSMKTTPAIFDGPFSLPTAETFSLTAMAASSSAAISCSTIATASSSPSTSVA